MAQPGTARAWKARGVSTPQEFKSPPRRLFKNCYYYDNMKKISAIKLVEKKSRFYSYLYDIKEESEIEDILKIHRKKYKKANHHCYGLLYKSKQCDIEVSKDDGEVGHPGKVLIDLLKKHNLNHHALVVSRVFGGIKLGVGGVSRAFREAGESAITQYKKK